VDPNSLSQLPQRGVRGSITRTQSSTEVQRKKPLFSSPLLLLRSSPADCKRYRENFYYVRIVQNERQKRERRYRQEEGEKKTRGKGETWNLQDDGNGRGLVFDDEL
jgi:hypothetical protein